MRKIVRWTSCIAGCATIVAAAASAHASTIGSLTPPGSFPSAGHAFVGQTFTAPAGEDGLSDVQVLLHNEGAALPATFNVYSYDPASTSFNSLLYTVPFVLSTNPAASDRQTLDFTPNVPLTGGQTYAFDVYFGLPNSVGSFYSAGNDYYSGGNAFFAGGNTGQEIVPNAGDLAFQATFGAVPEPATLAIAAPMILCLLGKRGQK